MSVGLAGGSPFNSMSPKIRKATGDFKPPSGKIPDGRVFERRDGWELIQDDSIGWMAIFTDQAARRAWMHGETYATITRVATGPANLDFSDDLSRWGSGMRYLVTDAGKYADAARAERDRRRANGMPDLTPSVDQLSTLEQDANALLIQIASLPKGASESQVRLFAERMDDLRGRFSAAQAQLDRIDGFIDLAGVAMMDATE